MLIVFAGLPGSGKSTLAQELARQLPARILDKDSIRAALFQPTEIEYSREQDDFCMQVVYQTAAYLLKSDPRRNIIVDGRPFIHAGQVQDLMTFFEKEHIFPHMIVCVCSAETARERLEQDVADGKHPAANRNFELYRRLKAQAEPVEHPHLVVNTDLGLQECARLCLEYLRSL